MVRSAVREGRAQPDAPEPEAAGDVQEGAPDDSGVFRSDRPIGKAGDRFRRARFAEMLARQITRLSRGESFALGLSGPWGSGKTSVLRMVEEELSERSDAVVLQFNPWLFSGTEDLIGHFFREIGAQLREKEKPTDWVQLGERLSLFGKYLSPVGKYLPGILTLAMTGGAPLLAPLVGAAAGAVTDLSGAVGDHMKGRGGQIEAQASSLHEQRAWIEQELRRINKKFVVMIDDLDRLEHDEIRDILRLVRLTADFPNVIYLVAYDRLRVEEVLDKSEGYGRAYLEKIFQAIYEVPRISSSVLIEYLVSELNALLKERPHIESSSDYLQNLVLQGVAPLFAQPREVKRYLNAVAFALECVGDEVTIADILGMEALRTVTPALFKALPATEQALVAPGGRERGCGKEQSKAQIEMLGSAAGDKRAQVFLLMSMLFPDARELGERRPLFYTSAESGNSYRKARRVASPEIFQIYFEHTLRAGTLPHADVREIFDRLGDEDVLEARLEKLSPEELEHLLERLLDYEQDVPPEAVEPAIVALMRQANRLPVGMRAVFDLGADFQMARVIVRLLMRLGPEARHAAASRIFDRTGELSSRLWLLSMIDPGDDGSSRQLVPRSLVELLLGRLRTQLVVARAPQLLEEPRLGHLLLRFASDEDVARHARELSEESEEFFVRLLSSSLRASFSMVVGSVAQQRKWILPWEHLERLLGRDLLGRRLATVAYITEESSRAEREREAIQTALKYQQGWRPERRSPEPSDGDADEGEEDQPHNEEGESEGSPDLQQAWAEAVRLAEEHEMDDALDLLYDAVDAALTLGDFAACDRLLKTIDVGRVVPDLLVGLLTITHAARGRLPSRSAFFEATRALLAKSTSPDELAKTVDGLG